VKVTNNATKLFKPLSITIEFEDIDEIKDMWLRTNLSRTSVVNETKDRDIDAITYNKNNKCCSFDVWKTIDTYLINEGVKVS
jgi:hypothetical protein